ncbi:hypothetical protein M2R48_06110 [Acinetobacter sp. I-MWF]|nr:hypothetical protein [Acinetobacter sp. I-MWF]
MRAILQRSLIKVICMGTLIIANQSWAEASKTPNKTDPQAAVAMQCSIKPCNVQHEAKKTNNESAKQAHVDSLEMAQKAQSSGVDMAHVVMKMDHSKMIKPATSVTPSK